MTADRCVRLAGTEYLAGSAIELARGVENSVRFTGISLVDAVALATRQPARLLGMEEEIGNIGKNASPNLILFQWNNATCEIDLIATILRGQVVYQKD